MKTFAHVQRTAGAAGLAMVLGLFSATAAAAQQTAEGLHRQFIRSNSYSSRVIYENERLPVFDPAAGQRWNGLHVDTSFFHLPGGDYAGAIGIVRNVSGLDYCIRPAYAFEDSQRWTSVQAAEPRTYLIEAGAEHLVVMAQALGGRQESLSVSVAFWRPDLSRERICSDVAPAGLESWARGFGWNNALVFSGSRR